MTKGLLLLTVIFLLVTGNYNTLSGQRFKNIKQAEDSLSAILASLNVTKDDSSKNVFNQLFLNALKDALQLPASDDYPFESLKSLVKISSPDDTFRIFHWNLPGSDGKHRYYGFLKILGHVPPKIFPLTDKSDSLILPDTAMLDNLHWFGALYYQVIPGETSTGKKIYTLLGWAGKNSDITQKVIEILWFDNNGKPHFGMNLFPDFQDGSITRIIFRFSATTTMSLKYEKQAIATSKQWNSRKRIFDYTLQEARMIVSDRMVPLDAQLEGQFQYYVAAGDIFDGFLFKQNCWTYIAGIDTKNRK